MLATVLPSLTRAAEREKGANANRQGQKGPGEGGSKRDRENKVGSNARRRAGSNTLSDHRENAGGVIASGGKVSRTTPATLISPTHGRSTGLVGRFRPQARKSSVVTKTLVAATSTTLPAPNNPSPKRTRSVLGGRRLTAWTVGSAGELSGRRVRSYAR